MMKPTKTSAGGDRSVVVDGGNTGSMRAEEDRTPVVDVRVSRFLKHPTGHTVYQVDVQLPRTRQLWVVYRRYRDFVELRQLLKTSCRTAPQHQDKAAASASSSASSSSSALSRNNASVKRSNTAGAEGSSASRKAATSGTKTANRSEAQAKAETIRGTQAVLAKYKFPSKLGFSGAIALRAERRKTLNAFLEALVKIRPVPQSVALFLGLLQDNRLGLDQHGNYVQVMHVENVLPIPKSPTNKRKQVAQTTTTAPSQTKTEDELPPSPLEKAAALDLPPYGAAVAAPATPSGSSEMPSGRNDVLGYARNTRAVGHLVESSAAVTSMGLAHGETARQATVGSRTWEGVYTVEVAGSARWGGANSSSSDTDEPTDCDSDADSEKDEVSNNSCGGGSDRVRTVNEQSGVSRSDNNQNRDQTLNDAEKRVDGVGVSGRNTNAVYITKDPFTYQNPPRTSAIRASDRGATTREATDIRDGASEAVARLRGGASAAGLKGGGGGEDLEDDSQDSGEEEGWSLVGSDEGRETTGKAGTPGCNEGRRGGEKDEEVDPEQEKRMIQWEFVNGFLEQVVSTVVARQDLDDGISKEEQSKSLPLSEEDRDLRMAELMSLGVDLPKDRLLTLLRYKDWGPQAATALYQDLIAAGKGSLEKIVPGSAVRGMENGGNTCYIDSLLFAMFATLDAFDWLLLKTLPTTDPPEVKLLQKHLRFLVNQLRKGAVIPREHSNLVRQHLRNCGWQGGPSSQEDVSELFTFLVILLRCPALPLSEALYHGGKSEDSDSRISTERALYLALPEEEEPERAAPPKSLSPARARASASGGRPPPPPRHPADKSVGRDKADAAGVTLEQILMHNFHDNRVEGLQRSISGEKGIQHVDAWRMVSMLPFYALSGEHAADTDPSNDLHFDTVMLPMVLKRYEAEEPGSASAPSAVGHPKMSRREVVVPLRLDCSKFMTPASTGKGGPAMDHGRFVLVLKSAVCHLGGESVSKGHYVAYTADRHKVQSEGKGKAFLKGSSSVGVSNKSGSHAGEGSGDSEASVSWLRLDDLRRDPAGRGFVEKIESVQDTTRVFSEDLGRHSYMLFYELVALNLEHVSKAQLEDTCRLIETQQDFEYAQHMQHAYNTMATHEGGAKGSQSETCSVS